MKYVFCFFNSSVPIISTCMQSNGIDICRHYPAALGQTPPPALHPHFACHQCQATICHGACNAGRAGAGHFISEELLCRPPMPRPAQQRQRQIENADTPPARGMGQGAREQEEVEGRDGAQPTLSSPCDPHAAQMKFCIFNFLK